MSRLDNYYESINALAAGQPEQFIHASEERYRNIIRRVAEQAVSSGAASIILLAGPSASGKTTRSEERRVGKECRSRGSPYH